MDAFGSADALILAAAAWGPAVLGAAAAIVLLAWLLRPRPDPMQAQALAVLNDRVAQLSAQIERAASRTTDSLADGAERTARQISAIEQRMAVLDRAAGTMDALARQVTGLEALLAGKQSRGAFGEAQLEALVRDVLPADAYAFQHTLASRTRVDCLLRLPDPPGPVCVDSKFPLEAFRALREAETDAGRTQALRRFRADVLRHAKDISSRYIVPGETADSALMFIPSEAVYATLHAELPDVVSECFRLRVFVVSPTTLVATLTTMLAVMRDVRMRKEARAIQAEVERLLTDVARLSQRVGNLRRHHGNMADDMAEIEVSAGRVVAAGTRIRQVETGQDTPAHRPEG